MSWLAAVVLLSAPWAGNAAPVNLFSDDFQSYSGAQSFGLQWQVQTGDWRVEAGRLVGRARDRGITWASAAPVSAAQQLEVLVVPGERLAPGGWAAAALVLWSGPSSYWRVALVEGPEGLRYAELLENRRDRWQAQNESPTALSQLPGGIEGFRWESGHPYRLRLAIAADHIEGEVADDATGEVLFRRGFALPAGAEAVRSGRPGLCVDVLEAAFDNVRATGTVALPPGEEPRRGLGAAVLDTGMTDTSPAVVHGLHRALVSAGVSCRLLSVEELVGAGAPPDDVGLLLLPHTRRLPAGVVTAVDGFLRAGGKALFFGGPFGQEALVKRGDRWVTVAEALSETPTGRVLVDFGREAPESWWRSHGPGDSALKRTVEPGPPDAGQALHVELSEVHNWDTLVKEFPTPPFQAGESLTCFWAKGDSKTDHLVLEWKEQDGSRWLTAVPLSTQWKRYVVAPGDSKFWADHPPPGRGGPEDSFRPGSASVFSFGLAQSHAPVTSGPHAYRIADLGVAASPLATASGPLPVLEIVSPAYKSDAPTGAVTLAPAADWLTPSGFSLPAPEGLRCSMRPSRGLGLSKARLGRWIPVLLARDAKGDERGAAASLYLSFAEPYENAAWGMVGTEDAAYLRDHLTALGPVVAAMAKQLLGGTHLVKAGSDRFSYFPEESPILGAQVADLSAQPQELRLEVTVSPKDRPTVLFSKTWPLSALPGVMTGASAPWSQPVEPGTYRVRAELWRGQELLDRIVQEFVRLPRPSASPRDLVTVRDGDFHLGDEPWHPLGINFWPSNATGLEAASYWLHWLDPSNYDPEVVARDLDHIAALHMNAVSISVGAADQLPALNHFLALCSQRGLRANVHLGGAYVTGVDVDRVVNWIRDGRLAENPAIWAWDAAWEPHLGDYSARCALDGRWAAWIAERYGSAASAEQDWHMSVPRRADGAVTGPSDEQLVNDGDHRVMVAAYRRFVDDLVSRCYGEWTRRVREEDPRHLIGVRSGWGGTGSPWADSGFPLDLVSGAKHLDFISPEGYSLSGPWTNFERGGFTTAYGRFAGGGKPVYWAEFGLSIYPEYTPEQFEAQRLFYEHLYHMALWSGASGAVGWWFPGGFRVDEKSDYGIMNPDGTPRPSALEARRWVLRFAEKRPRLTPTAWITIDRDLHPRGYSEVWRRGADEYVRDRRAGHFVGLRTPGTGTDSTTVPLVAVGNSPATGSNPPKFLNGESNTVSVRAGGQWIEVQPGATIDVPANHALELAVSVGNTAEATWLSPAHAGSKPGGVFLVSAPGGAVTVHQPLRGDVPRFGDAMVGPFVISQGLNAEARVTLGLVAEGRTPFGERFSFVLRPRG